jgi:pimeloyl-ACP methyl ester carboxylesterase
VKKELIIPWFLLAAISAASVNPGARGWTVAVNGIRLYYELHGKGEPLLLIHGGLGSVENFSNQIPALEGRFLLICPDSRGHSRTMDSDRPLSYRLMASDMAVLMDSLHVEQASVLGWSDGGIIGLYLAIDHPRRIKKLAAVGANFLASGLRDIESVKRLNSENAWAPVRESYKRLSPDPCHWPAFLEKVKAMWLSQPDLSVEELGRIRCPTLIVAGDRDAIRIEHSVQLFQSIPGAQLFVVPGATHFLLSEKPKLVNGILADFLQNPATGMVR